MAKDDGRERRRCKLLRPSTCTPAHVEGRAREGLRSWRELRAERKALERDKRLWFGSVSRRVDPQQPFCFELDRQRLIELRVTNVLATRT